MLLFHLVLEGGPNFCPKSSIQQITINCARAVIRSHTWWCLKFFFMVKKSFWLTGVPKLLHVSCSSQTLHMNVIHHDFLNSFYLIVFILNMNDIYSHAMICLYFILFCACLWSVHATIFSFLFYFMALISPMPSFPQQIVDINCTAVYYRGNAV